MKTFEDVFLVFLLNLNTDFYWCSTIIRRKEQPLITATAQLAVRVSEEVPLTNGGKSNGTLI